MNLRIALAASVAALTLITFPGCAVQRGQESVGSYIDDAGITTRIKSGFVESHSVDAASIKVETLNGVVMLSGFAKDAKEKTRAEEIARAVTGVTGVKNEISVRP